MTNFMNEWYDGVDGVDGVDRLQARVLQPPT